MINWENEALKRQEYLLADLQNLIAIPSVLDESAATEDLPFGPEPKRALDWIVRRRSQSGNACEKYRQYGGTY